MDFEIQLSNPEITGKKDIEDTTINECIQTIFSFDSEVAFIRWLGIYIPLDYKYTVSTICEDIMNILEELMKQETGSIYNHFPSNDFFCEWNIAWQGDFIFIESKWLTVTGDEGGLLEELLNKLGIIKVNKSQFIYEWGKLLGKVLESLGFCGYSEKDIPEISRLKSIYERSY